MGPGYGFVQVTDSQGNTTTVFEGSFGGGSPPAYGGPAGIFSGSMAPGSTLGTNFIPGWFTSSGHLPLGGFIPKPDGGVAKKKY